MWVSGDQSSCTPGAEGREKLKEIFLEFSSLSSLACVLYRKKKVLAFLNKELGGVLKCVVPTARRKERGR